MKKLYPKSAFITFTLITSFMIINGCSKKSSTEPEPSSSLPEADYYAPKADTAPTIDGKADEAIWNEADWAPMDQLWAEQQASPSDFSGKYKIVWDEEKLYYLFEIGDDVLSDVHNNPTVDYWKDDCLEIFIDEDASGGDHTNNYNAFAYHIALDYQAADIGMDGQAHLYTEHVTTRRTSAGTTHTWEVALTPFTSAYIDALGATNVKSELKAGKQIGYACAYCDGDGAGSREHFYGSIYIPGQNKNVAWQDADVFGKLLLTDE